ncbi:MAG: hypothetical protein AMXMBFR23_06210 [Chloroflexota bacterium]
MNADRTRAVFEQWLALATEGGDFLSTIGAFCALDCRIHLPNGILADSQAMAQQTMAARLFFPDMAVEIERAFFLSDHLVVQAVVAGTTQPVMPHLAAVAGEPMRSFSLMVCEVNDEGRFSGVWTYVNIGAGALFPVPPGALDAPFPSSPHPSGTLRQAQDLYQAWTDEMERADMPTALAAVAEPDCLVYATNGVVGDLAMMQAHAAIVAQGYPDLSMEIENVLFFEDRVLIQMLFSATHTGRLGIWEPTGRHVRFTGVVMMRVAASGRAAEMWPLLSPGSPLIFPVEYEA